MFFKKFWCKFTVFTDWALNKLWKIAGKQQYLPIILLSFHPSPIHVQQVRNNLECVIRHTDWNQIFFDYTLE